MYTRTLVKMIGLAVVAFTAPAQAQSLGSSYQQVASLYGDAAPAKLDGAPALELRDVNYAGLKWSRVDFVFDPARRLTRMQMTTDRASYDAVLQLAAQQLDAGDGNGPELTASPAHRTQIRVCEDETGAVTVTYEPYASSS